MKKLKIVKDTSNFEIYKYFTKLTNNNNVNKNNIDSVDWLLGKTKGKLYFEMNMIKVIKEILDSKKLISSTSFSYNNGLDVYILKRITREEKFLWSKKTIISNERVYLFAVEYDKSENIVILHVHKKEILNTVEDIAYDIINNIGLDVKIKY